MLGEASSKIADSCLLMENIENDKKAQMKNMEIIQHHVNKLELELRTQGDISQALQIENESLGEQIHQLRIANSEIETLKTSYN